jgi:hypothetical protein
MANYTKTADGFYQVPIIALGERLRDNFGLTIREHPHFDAVDPVHSKNSYHYANQAIDVQDHRDDVIDGVDWRTRTGNLENLLTGSGVEAEYDRLRREDPRQASIEGMKMHKAYFGKN